MGAAMLDLCSEQEAAWTPLDGAVASQNCNTQCDQEGFGLVHCKLPLQELSVSAVEQSLI